MNAVNWTRAPEYTHVKKQVDKTTGAKTFNIFKLDTAGSPAGDGYFTDHQPLTLNLPDGEFVTSYTLDLGPYGGDADATAETARAYDGDAGSGQATSDYQVLGRPYIYKGQANKLYTAGSTDQEKRFQTYIDNAISTAHVDYNRYYAPDTFLTSTDKSSYLYNNWRIVNGYERQYNYPGSYVNSWVLSNSAKDTAWMVGYKVRYGYQTGIQTENNGALTDNTENPDGHGVLTPRAVVKNGSGSWVENNQTVPSTNSFAHVASTNNVVPEGAWAKKNGTDYTLTNYTDGYGNITARNVILWNSDTKRVYDYGDERVEDYVGGAKVTRTDTDNLTPTKATYEVRFQNAFDGNTASSTDNLRAAHLARVKLKSTFDENVGTASKKVFRLQNVYVPAYLVNDADNKYSDHVECADHAQGTCISYQYSPFVKVGDGYEPYNGPRKLVDGKQVADGGDHDGEQIYLTITGDTYTKDDSAYIEALACGGQDHQLCSCVECDGGWFNATDFTFTYVDAEGTEQKKSVTWAELVEDGRVSGPWKIDDTEPVAGIDGTGNNTARIVYDENDAPIYDADGDYVIDFESFFRNYDLPFTEPDEGEDGDGTEGEGGEDAGTAAAADETPDAVTGNAIDIISYSTYKATEATNTIKGFANANAAVAPYDNAEVDQTYAKPLFTSLQITFEAANANRRFDNTMLDAGQWLARKSEHNVGTTVATSDNSNLMVNYAFKYDGTFVDRPVAQFLAAPTKLDRHAVYPMADNGSAMSPFYTSLCLWIGAIFMVALMSAQLSPAQVQALTARRGRPPTQAEQYLGRYGVFCLLGLAQALIVGLGNVFFLGVQCEHFWLYLAACCLASVVFTNLVYTLTVSFGNIGKALAIIGLVLQLAGAGGLMPVQMLSAPLFGAIYPWLPFAHSMPALEGAMAGIYGNQYLVQMAELAAFLIPSLALGLIFRRPVIRLNNWVLQKLDETKFL